MPRAERDALTAAAATPFQTPDYASAFDAAGATTLAARATDAEGNLTGHALLLEETFFGFKTWLGLGDPHLREPATREAFWEALLRAAAIRGVVSAAWRDLTTTRLDTHDAAALRRAAAKRGGLATQQKFVTSCIRLDATADDRWTRLHRKHRNAIRHAQTDGVTAGPAPREGFAKTFTALSDETWARSDRPGPAGAYYERLLENEWARPYVATDANGTPAAAAIVTHWQQHAVYLHGASTTQTAGASTLLQWTILQDLQRNRIASYDLGGSPHPTSPSDTERTAGIRRFKERFGGDVQAWNTCHVKVHPRYYAKARRLLQTRMRR